MAGRGLGGLFLAATILVDQRSGTKFHDAAALVVGAESEAATSMAGHLGAWTRREAARGRGGKPGHGGAARGWHGWRCVLGNESAVRKSEWRRQSVALKRLHRCGLSTRIAMAGPNVAGCAKRECHVKSPEGQREQFGHGTGLALGVAGQTGERMETADSSGTFWRVRIRCRRRTGSDCRPCNRPLRERERGDGGRAQLKFSDFGRAVSRILSAPLARGRESFV